MAKNNDRPKSKHLKINKPVVSYSDLFMEFIGPFINQFPKQFPNIERLHFATLCWNVANMQQLLPDALMSQVMPQEEDTELKKVTESLINHKIQNFEEYTDCIVDFEITNVYDDNTIELSVVTKDIYTYLDMVKQEMIDEGEIDEDEFDEDEFDFDDEDDFENDDEEEGMINRISITVSPKPAFINWVNQLNPDFEFDQEELVSGTVYLIEDRIEDSEVVDWLANNTQRILTLELVGRFIDENDFPEKLDDHLLNKWFSVSYQARVYDLHPKPIKKFSLW